MIRRLVALPLLLLAMTVFAAPTQALAAEQLPVDSGQVVTPGGGGGYDTESLFCKYLRICLS